MTMVRAQKRRLDFKLHAAAKTAGADGLLIEECSHVFSLREHIVDLVVQFFARRVCSVMRVGVNSEEQIGKTVGRQRPADAFVAAMKLQKTMNRLQSHLLGFPKGIFRFATHDDADAWLRKWMSRRRPKN
ncbi:MAG: hypothetical protein ACR2FX_09550 [Chthoniobacterales bacterium]